MIEHRRLGLGQQQRIGQALPVPGHITENAVGKTDQPGGLAGIFQGIDRGIDRRRLGNTA